MSSSKIDFRTEVTVNNFPFRISYQTPVLFCGSCFAENIGGIMHSYKMPVQVNPFGVVYNPFSVARVLRNILQNKEYTSNDLHSRNGLWFSFDHYTRFSSESKDECLLKINEACSSAHEFIKKANLIGVTFGTARVYRLVSTGKVVANCHKIPAKEFTHTLLSVDEIVSEWTKLIDEVLAVIPNIRFLFTVSPIRHWKDGPIGNQLSKSTLILAVHRLVEIYSDKAFYFPGYEIMMDDLRDYRFYDSDMLHPSQLAIDYIWQKFSDALIEHQAMQVTEKVHRIQQALSHRPVNPKSHEFKMFVDKILNAIDSLQKQYPFLNFEEEVIKFRRYTV